MEKCKNCKFFELVDDINGKCHRHAPSPTVAKGGEQDTYTVVMPTMKIEDWCGEYSLTIMPNMKTVGDVRA